MQVLQKLDEERKAKEESERLVGEQKLEEKPNAQTEFETEHFSKENEILSSAGDCWVWFITQYYHCSHRRAVQQRWSIYPYPKIEFG